MASHLQELGVCNSMLTCGVTIDGPALLRDGAALIAAVGWTGDRSSSKSSCEFGC